MGWVYLVWGTLKVIFIYLWGTSCFPELGKQPILQSSEGVGSGIHLIKAIHQVKDPCIGKRTPHLYINTFVEGDRVNSFGGIFWLHLRADIPITNTSLCVLKVFTPLRRRTFNLGLCHQNGFVASSCFLYTYTSGR